MKKCDRCGREFEELHSTSTTLPPVKCGEGEVRDISEVCDECKSKAS